MIYTMKGLIYDIYNEGRHFSFKNIYYIPSWAVSFGTSSISFKFSKYIFKILHKVINCLPSTTGKQPWLQFLTLPAQMQF